MTDQKIYRIAGISALATMAVFFIEFPFYLVRGAFPTMAEACKLPDFAARNATNIMTCVLLDLVILSLFMVFAAGFRHLIRQAGSGQEWLGALFFGVGLVYTTLTLVADSLQAATVVDALTVPADPTIIRALMESMYLMYGSVALWLMALLMGIAGYATLASAKLPNPVLPGWSGWVACACAIACLAFVPSMFCGHPDPTGFYNPAGWGPLGVASGFPLAAWMIVAGIFMIRAPRRREIVVPE
jgi:hypothetical protein